MAKTRRIHATMKDQWDVAMDALMEGDARRAAKITQAIRTEHGSTVNAPEAFSTAVRKAPQKVRDLYFTLTEAMLTAPGGTEDLIGRRVCWTGMGFSLLTEGGTLWRPTKGAVCGTVVGIQPHRFYQNKENIAWLKVKLDKAHGRYKYAQAYFDESTGRLFNPTHESTRFET
jgi:hypothetical protein